MAKINGHAPEAQRRHDLSQVIVDAINEKMARTKRPEVFISAHSVSNLGLYVSTGPTKERVTKLYALDVRTPR